MWLIEDNVPSDGCSCARRIAATPVRTDTDVYLRFNRWYRRRLGRYFEPAGGGFGLKKPVEAFIWTLDRR